MHDLNAGVVSGTWDVAFSEARLLNQINILKELTCLA